MSDTSMPPPDDLPVPNLSLTQHIEHRVAQYFLEIGAENLHGSHDLYALLLTQFEKPLLNVVYQQTHGNQTLMAQILGLNRGTLRKKLKQHGFLD